MSDKYCAILGGVTGTVIAGWLFIAAPMMRNYQQCGTVFLCLKEHK